MTAAPIIVTALMGNEDFRWFDAQRRRYYPPERNVLRAHLTMFSHLPPSCKDELLGRLRAAASEPAPRASVFALMSLDTGVAYRIQSSELEHIRNMIAEAFADLLIPQDRVQWQPHVTVLNKVKPAIARTLMTALWSDFTVRTMTIAGLAAAYYRGGPWEPIAAYRFGSGQPMKAPSPLMLS